jgi:hypothetical protein
MEKMQEDYRFSAYFEKDGIKFFLTYHKDTGIFVFTHDWEIRGILPLSEFPFIVLHFGRVGLKFNREI